MMRNAMTCTGGTKPDHVLAPSSPYHANIQNFYHSGISQNVFMDDADADVDFESGIYTVGLVIQLSSLKGFVLVIRIFIK